MNDAVKYPSLNRQSVSITGATGSGDASLRVNAKLPSWVATDGQLKTRLNEKTETGWPTQATLKGRLQENDGGHLALFLAADESNMITGQCIAVDAGRT